MSFLSGGCCLSGRMVLLHLFVLNGSLLSGFMRFWTGSPASGGLASSSSADAQCLSCQAACCLSGRMSCCFSAGLPFLSFCCCFFQTVFLPVVFLDLLPVFSLKRFLSCGVSRVFLPSAASPDLSAKRPSCFSLHHRTLLLQLSHLHFPYALRRLFCTRMSLITAILVSRSGFMSGLPMCTFSFRKGFLSAL